MTTSTPPAQSRQPSYYPAFSYSAAMKCSFSLPEQGERVTVETCSAGEFCRFIDRCLNACQPSEALQACSLELLGLDYAEPLSRWFALNTLHEYKIPIALSYDASASAHQEVCYYEQQ